MEKMATINDVAERAGVGKGTVDRVIHNRGRVSEDTKKKVLRAIEELDYKPNRAAQLLAQKNNFRIAVVYHDKESEFWSQVESGITRAQNKYQENGVTVDRFVLPKIDVEGQINIIEKAIEEKYDGLAIVPYFSERISEALNRAVKQGIRVVTFNNDEECDRICYVGQDLRQSGRTAGLLMSMMAPENARYAVVLPVIKRMSALHGRYQGFQEVLLERRKDMIMMGVFNYEQDGQHAYEELSELLKENRFDAIYASNVILADVAKAVHDAGMGDQILLIGHDLTESIRHYIENGVIDVSIGQEPEQQGYIAIDRICRNLLLGDDIYSDHFTKIEIVVSENMSFI